MDIKSIRFRFGKKQFTIFILVIMFLLSLTMIYRYNYVQIKIKENKTNPFQSEDYVHNLVKTNYYLYYKNVSSQTKKYESPSNIFLSEDTVNSMIKNINVDYYSSRLDSIAIRESFNYIFNNLGDFIANSDGNLKYMCRDTKNNFKIENYCFNDINSNTTKDVFRNYIEFTYDSEGRGQITNSYGFNVNHIKNYFLDINANEKIISDYSFLKGEDSSSISNYKIEPIKNMKFIYAVPRNVDANFYTSDDVISNYINESERSSYMIISTITKVIIIFIAVLTIVIPTRKIRLFLGVERFCEFPLEVLIGIFAFLYHSLIAKDIPIKVVRETITGDFLKLVIDNGFDLKDAKQIVNVINISYWLIVFTITFILFSIVKIAFRTGLKKYIKEHCLTIRVFKISWLFVYNKTRIFLDVNLRKKYDRLYIYGVFLSLAGIISAGLLFEFGYLIFLVIFFLYMFILIIYIKIVREIMIESSMDYDHLLSLTKEIADGNLDKDISSEEAGIYEDIKIQLDRIQKAYKKSVEEEVKSQKMKSELISNISHDLKTPLTSILSYTDLLRNIDTNEESKKYIDTIYRKSERLKILIDDMFEISKAQTGNIYLDMNDIDIIQLAKQSIFEVNDKMSKRGIQIRTNFPDKKIILNLDGEKVYRVFENLLVNISKYGLENTRAYVSIKETEDSIEIEFKNISQMEIDYDVEDIIERFRRGDKSRNTEGSGLGLSIAKSYIEAMDGEFRLELDDDIFKARVIFKKNEVNV